MIDRSASGTLIDAVVPRLHPRNLALARDAVLVICAVALLAACAQISIPWYPVPLTGQTFGVFLVGGLLGTMRGVLATALYWAVGALGLSVFANASGGWDTVSGPTGGYLLGFIVAAGLIGFLCERGADRRVLPAIGAFFLGEVIILGAGVVWLALWTPPGAAAHFGWQNAYDTGLEPFLAGDLVKMVAAAGLLPAGWSLVSRLGPERRRGR